MRPTIFTTAILLSLAFLCFQSNALVPQLEFTSSSFRRNFIMNAHATSSGRVQLKRESNTTSSFYVDADFSSIDPSQSKSPSVIFDSVKMLISITNEDTLVSSSCLNFASYDCSRYNCVKYDKIKSDIDFPTFSASGATQIKSSIILDYNYWKINASYFYLADSCNTQDTTTGLGKDRSGVLGLGTGPLSSYYYWYTALFSVLIDSDLNGGELRFMKDDESDQSASPLHTFVSNGTWQILTNYSDYITLSGNKAFLTDGNVMFDVNFDAIGLPNDLYTTVLSYFISDHTVSCNSDNYRAYCYTAKKLEDLPDIILSVNNSQIIIPSKIYATFDATSGDKTFFYFNFKATSPVLSGHSYVSPSFKNSIILDAHFMSYYLTVFNGSSIPNYIKIYSTTTTPSQQPSYAKWIVLGALGVIVAVGIWFWVQKKRATSKKAAGATINTTTEGCDATQALVHNQYSYAPPAVGDMRERAKQ